MSTIVSLGSALVLGRWALSGRALFVRCHTIISAKSLFIDFARWGVTLVAAVKKLTATTLDNDIDVAALGMTLLQSYIIVGC